MNIRKLAQRVLSLPKDSKSENEIAPGVVEERRLMLWTPAIVIAGMLFGGAETIFAQEKPPSSGSPNLSETGDLGFDAFVQQSLALVKEAAQTPNLNEEAHISRLSSLISRLRLAEVPNAKLGKFTGLTPVVEFGPIKVSAPLALIQWRLAPGATLPPHNHNPADVISVCIEGEATVRHFENEGELPDYSSNKTFLIRETRNDILKPGRMSTLTNHRDNIHTFIAGKDGAMGMDVNTILPGNRPFSFLEFSPKPRDPERRIYEAVWKKIG